MNEQTCRHLPVDPIRLRVGDDFACLSFFVENEDGTPMVAASVAVEMVHQETLAVAAGVTASLFDAAASAYEVRAPRTATVEWYTGVYDVNLSVIDGNNVKTTETIAQVRVWHGN